MSAIRTGAGVQNTPPMMGLALAVLAAAALAPVIYITLGPDIDPVPVYIAPSHGGPADQAAPNNDPRQAGLLAAGSAAAPAPALPFPAIADAGFESGATPNHDPRHRRPATFLALNQAPLLAEPEPAANDVIAQQIVASQQVAAEPAAASDPVAPAPTFIATDTTLYAKDNARLRAAPATTAEVITRLPADAPIHATARSADGAWWRVARAGGAIGFIHQDAVTQTRMAKLQPQPASQPVVATAARPQPAQSEFERQSNYIFGYVDRTMTWLADQAGGGTPPKVVRSER